MATKSYALKPYEYVASGKPQVRIEGSLILDLPPNAKQANAFASIYRTLVGWQACPDPDRGPYIYLNLYAAGVLVATFPRFELSWVCQSNMDPFVKAAVMPITPSQFVIIDSVIVTHTGGNPPVVCFNPEFEKFENENKQK